MNELNTSVQQEAEAAAALAIMDEADKLPGEAKPILEGLKDGEDVFIQTAEDLH